MHNDYALTSNCFEKQGNKRNGNKKGTISKSHFYSDKKRAQQYTGTKVSPPGCVAITHGISIAPEIVQTMTLMALTFIRF